MDQTLWPILAGVDEMELKNINISNNAIIFLKDHNIENIKYN